MSTHSDRMRRPRSIFRARRRGAELYVGERPPLPAVAAFVAQHRDRFRPGVVTELVIEHDHDCRYPAGEPCTCRNGPEIRIRDENPEEN